MEFRLPALGEGIESATVTAGLVQPRHPVAAATPPRPAPGWGGSSPRPAVQRACGGKVEFKLPALGEGIDSATVTAVLVKPGDAVEAGQHVLGVETDKAAMEIETDVAGTVEQV